MPIVSSQIVLDHQQVDGRRHVQERHIDHRGVVNNVFYLAEPGADANTALNARVPVLTQQLRERERSECLEHVQRNQSIMSYRFADITLRDGARHVLRVLRYADDARPFRSYAQRVVNAGAAQVANLLGISLTAAQGVVNFAQSVLSSIDAHDTGRTQADPAMSEIGEQ